MLLSELILKTNKGYDLGLNDAQQILLKDRLRMAGCPNTVEKKAITGTVGVILEISKSVKPNKALETYSRLKKSSIKEISNKCPRCNNRMIKADIVNRKVSYCTACRVALPLPVA